MGLLTSEAKTSRAERWRGADLSQSEVVSLSGLRSIYLLVPHQDVAGGGGGSKDAGKSASFSVSCHCHFSCLVRTPVNMT